MSELATLSPDRVKVERLQDALLKLPQVTFEVKHYFAKGVYAREIIIPKGCCLVGRIHTQSQINTVSKGDISVTTENGIVRVQAPCTLVGKPGRKRAGYAHEETVWTTYLGTDKTDPDEIFETLTALTYEQYEKLCAQGMLALNGE